MNDHPRVGKILALASLGAIALLMFHVIGTLLFTVLGLAPSSPNWPLVPILGGILAIAGAGAGMQSFKLPQGSRRLGGAIAGVAAGAVLGFFGGGQLTGQKLPGAIAGVVGGATALGAIGHWAFKSQSGKLRGFGRVAIALMGCFCAYGVAFGLGAWTLAAATTGRWGLAALLGPLALMYLWLTKRTIEWVYRQGRQQLWK